MTEDSKRQGGSEDMVLVPRTPTKEMLEAAWADANDEDAAGVWRSMIDAWLAVQNRKDI